MEQPEDDLRFIIEPLAKHHDRPAFACGVKALDVYLQRQAGQDVNKRVAVAFVMTPDGRTIAGFYTLSQFAIELDVMPEEVVKRLPKYLYVPVTLLGRLAVDVRFRGRGLGEILLMDALSRSNQGSRQLGSAGVVVDAKDDRAKIFYKRYGFLELPKVPNRLYMPMGSVAELLKD